jgi:Carboxypeptidase regulatory-like domain
VSTGRVCAALLFWSAVAYAAAPSAGLSIEVSVVDSANQPVPWVRVELKTGQATVSTVVTDQKGLAQFTGLKPARYEISAAKDGFETAQKSDLDLSQSLSASIELTLVPALARRDSVEVKGTAAPLDEGGSWPHERNPSRPPGYAQAAFRANHHDLVNRVPERL